MKFAWGRPCRLGSADGSELVERAAGRLVLGLDDLADHRVAAAAAAARLAGSADLAVRRRAIVDGAANLAVGDTHAVADDHGSRFLSQLLYDLSSFAHQKLKFNVDFNEKYSPWGCVRIRQSRLRR